MNAGLKCPTRPFIGPWAHAYPRNAKPEPAIDGLKDLVRWWDQWLKGIDTGIMREPCLRAYMQESVPPATFYENRAGRWVAEERWPSPHIEPRSYHLNAPGTLDARAKRERRIEVCSEQATGQSHGDWCPYGYEAEMPSDQREEDGRSLCFETAPLGRDLEILGAPVLELELASDRANAAIYVRLCDVAPGGASTRVSYGVLNLTHRESHESPAPLTPGERYRIRLPLNDAAHCFPRGHRIRIGIATAAWPLVWPSPEVATVCVWSGISALRLPVRPRRATDRELASLGKPATAAPVAVTDHRPARRTRRLRRDYSSGETIIEMVKDRGHHRLEAIGLSFGGCGEETYRIAPEDPLSARAEVTYRIEIERDASYHIAVDTRFVLTSTTTDFLLTTEANAYERGQRVYARTWSERIPRDLV
jgi:predicted acyl esterase